MIEYKRNVASVITIKSEIDRAETSNALRAALKLFDIALEANASQEQLGRILHNRSRVHDLFLAVWQHGDREPSDA